MTFVPGIGNTGPLMGPVVIGFMLGSILVGILAMQVQSYYSTFPNDRLWMKWLVGVIFGLEVLFTVLTLISAWSGFGVGWGDINTLKTQHWSSTPLSVLNGIIASMVQFFFAYRIFKLTTSRNLGAWRWLLPTVICTISTLQCVMIFYVCVTNAARGRSFITLYKLSTYITIWLVGVAICDIIITVSTVIILIGAKHQSQFHKTDITLKRLIRLSVETGLITASGAIVDLIMWQTEKYLNYHYIFFLILGKLYSNAMMAALNSRSGSSHSMNSDTSMNTVTVPNNLTLFQDEYPEVSESHGATLQPASTYQYYTKREEKSVVSEPPKAYMI